MKTYALAVLFALALPGATFAAAPAAPAPTPAKPAASAPPVASVSVSTAPPPTPASIYTTERLRDPFAPLSQGGGGGGVNAAGKAFGAEDFNIHNLSLRGMMKDSKADYALFQDENFGVSFVLRRGRLYDSKNKPVRGVTGRLRVNDRWAELETAEHDVQIFRLGDENKD